MKDIDLLDQANTILQGHTIPIESSLSIARELQDKLCEKPGDNWSWIYFVAVVVASIGALIIPLIRCNPLFRFVEFKLLTTVISIITIGQAIIHCFVVSSNLDGSKLPMLAILLGILTMWTIELFLLVMFGTRDELLQDKFIQIYGSSHWIRCVLSSDVDDFVKLGVAIYFGFPILIVGITLGLSGALSLFFALFYIEYLRAMELDHCFGDIENNESQSSSLVSLISPITGFFGYLLGVSCRSYLSFKLIPPFFNGYTGGILVYIYCVHLLRRRFCGPSDRRCKKSVRSEVNCSQSHT